MDKLEAGLSQGFNNRQIFVYIISPNSYSQRVAIYHLLTVTVIKDTSFLYLLSPYKNCLVGAISLYYYEPSQILYHNGIVALASFRWLTSIFSYSLPLKQWERVRTKNSTHGWVFCSSILKRLQSSRLLCQFTVTSS